MYVFTQSVRYCCQILTKIAMCRQILVKLREIKLKKPFRFSSSYMRTNGRTDRHGKANRRISKTFRFEPAKNECWKTDEKMGRPNGTWA
jgi:hypothetical protein